MNEAETRAEYIDPLLKQSGWAEVENTKILREHRITEGRIQKGGERAKALIADYVLVYNNRKLAVIEAKSEELSASEGVAQAKDYAQRLNIDYTYSTNGKEIYEISMRSGKEGNITVFPTPQELWQRTFTEQNDWQDKFNEVLFEDIGGTKPPYPFQEVAINKVMDAIASEKQRILLTLATGTGKTFIAFQIVWKLFYSRWNLRRDGKLRPRILFLADRNILAGQAFNTFSPFQDDALVRITPNDIRKKKKILTNGSIFFTIFQTFMSELDGKANYGDYPKDFFDLVIVDECHRGGARDKSTWRGILEYFSPAVQLGLTATPKRRDNVDTYNYFGRPVYEYSLKSGINDGFLTPFRVRRIETTLDNYMYVDDDEIIEGEVEVGDSFESKDFNRHIVIKEREEKRVKLFMAEIDQNEKTIVFCKNQIHALVVRDLINQNKTSKDPLYCVRVTSDEGKLGEQYLADFKDNEKTIPTILTTSQKLSTGVDARNIRNIVLMRDVGTMIEFKQIIGRGTRLFEGKEYFTIYDFEDACKKCEDIEWDGEPILVIDDPIEKPEPKDDTEEKEPKEKRQKIRIKLADGKFREIESMMSTSFWSPDGRPISAEEFIKNLFGVLPNFFKSEKELRAIWSKPNTRKVLLEKLAEMGYGKDELLRLQKMINAEKSDIFDVLEYVSYAVKPITRETRVNENKSFVFKKLDNEQKDFIEFVLSKYIETGVNELAEEKLPSLIKLKYGATSDATKILGTIADIRDVFITFQKSLYEKISV